MGRKKIAITRITDERNRQITFSKRKAGLLKKAYELSILCDCEIAVIMITNNRKLYQYASSNMNSILIRYTEFKDPDESKTNADILDDIQRKERGSQHGDESGDDEDPAASMQSSFMLTPRTQAQYGKMNEEFDHMLQHNQILSMPDQLSGGSGAQGRGPPQVMPVTVPVTHSPGAINLQIQQHLAQQMEMRAGSSAAINSANSASSSGTMSSLISPQSDLSASPSSAKSLKSPSSMPPPVGTPTRLQTLRNHSLKLHLPGSGRNYISLGSGGSASPGGKKGSAGGGGREGEEGEGDAGGGGGMAGSKPHLRVMIPGQKGFIPRTQAISPLPHMELTTTATGAKETTATTTTKRDRDGGRQTHMHAAGNASTMTAPHTTTHTESLTTPVLSMATPNLLSSLPPPLFSSLTGEFPFSALMSGGIGSIGGGGGGGGAGAGGELSSALVAFPVSIQPSSSTGPNATPGNIVLQAQNMGQPFLLTPNIDPRQNPMMTPQTFTPPASSLSPNMRDLEQLKHQYERVQQQLLQQQLFISQQLHHQQQQQQQTPGKEGAPVVAMQSAGALKASPTPRRDPGASGSSASATESGSQEKPAFRPSAIIASSPRDTQEDMDTDESTTPTKRPRLDSSPEQPTSV